MGLLQFGTGGCSPAPDREHPLTATNATVPAARQAPRRRAKYRTRAAQALTRHHGSNPATLILNIEGLDFSMTALTMPAARPIRGFPAALTSHPQASDPRPSHQPSDRPIPQLLPAPPAVRDERTVRNHGETATLSDRRPRDRLAGQRPGRPRGDNSV